MYIYIEVSGVYIYIGVSGVYIYIGVSGVYKIQGCFAPAEGFIQNLRAGSGMEKFGNCHWKPRNYIAKDVVWSGNLTEICWMNPWFKCY